MTLPETGWTESTHANLEKLLSGPPGLAAFDFDNTLIRGDLGEAVMYYILLQGLIAADLPEFWQEAEHSAIPAADMETWKQLWKIYSAQEDAFSYEKLVEGLIQAYDSISARDGLEAAYRWTRVLFCGMPESELAGLARHVFAENQLPDLAPLVIHGKRIDNSIRLRIPLLQLVQAFTKAGWDVRIVTASPECTIQTASPAFGIPPEKVRGMRLEVENGILMPRIIEPMTFDGGKVRALRETTQEKLKFAAGDSFTDLGLLMDAENRLLVDRGNAKLRALGQEHGFWIEKAESLDAVQ